MKEIPEKEKVIRLKLNMPPSVNEYFSITKNGKTGKPGKRVISEKGKKYKAYVMKQVTLLVKPEQLFTSKNDRLEMFVHQYPKINNRDIDNIYKCLLDSLTDAHVWYDDKCVKHLNTWMHKSDKNNGFITIEIKQETEDY